MSVPYPSAPLLSLIGPIDYAVLAFYLLAMLAIGFYFQGEQKTTQDFFLGGRSLGWFPLGMSLMATLISALSYTGVPGQGYEQGWKVLAIPAAIWLTTPIVLWVAVPIFRGLRLFSIYEYLELRFDARTRLTATILFAVWRLLWLGGVLYAPCKALSLTAGWNVPDWVLIVILGAVTTVYTFLGGIKAVVWTDVIQGLTMLLGIFVVIVGVWLSVAGGPARVWEVTAGLGRTNVVDWNFSWTQRWSVWAFLPHYFLAMLSFYLADQITAQRFLCTRDVAGARQSFLLNAVVLTILFPGLTYIGLCLMTFFHDHPDKLQPRWVANVDAVSRTGILRDGKLLLDPQLPQHSLTKENLPQLVREGRILQPNLQEPFTDVAEFTDPATGEIDAEKLAKRRPNKNKLRGEVILNRRAGEELLPVFVANHLLPGVAGLILAALIAASMSSVDSGLNSIVTLLIKDFHERFGWGTKWLATRVGKSVDTLDDVDRLHLAQPLTLVIGVAATLFGMVVGRIGNIFDIMLGGVNTFGAPLLAVFLLGMFTRRGTAKGAFAALVGGSLFTVGLMGMTNLARRPGFEFLWPAGWAIPVDVWIITFGTLFSFVLGYIVSLVGGDVRPVSELRGLVCGLGELGVRTPAAGGGSAGPGSTAENEIRWR